jgi:hypothetical protein
MKNRSWLVVALVVAGCGTDVDPVVPSRPPDAAVPLPDDAAVPASADAAPAARVDAAPPDAAGLTTSGTRIRQMIGTTPDGAREPRGWFDQQLGLRCFFTETADGKTRCVPLDRASLLEGRFTDATCTHPLALDYNGCAHAYGISFAFTGGDTCGEVGARIWALTPYSGTIYLVNSNGLCVATNPQPAEYALFSATELPPSTFQEMTVSIE